MSIFELLKSSWTALMSNKIRTSLTMLGIVIGIGSVIAMLAIGNGSQKSIESSVTWLGSNLLTISSAAVRTGVVRGAAGGTSTLTPADVTAISDNSKISGVSAVSPETSSNLQVIGGGNNLNASINGVMPEYLKVHSFEIASGSFISSEDSTGLTKVAVLGPDAATTLFGSSDSAVGQTIRINKINFKVIGTTVAKGSSGFNNPDSNIYVPLATAQKILFGQTNIRTIVVQASSGDTINNTQDQINNLLMERHGITDSTQADFTIRNSADTLATLSSVTYTFTLLLASIGGISLLVGGIGIMNIMIVTVTERTREIGLRKAIGAKSSVILTQFLIEALMLTLIGGLIGVGVGSGVAITLSNLNILTAVVTPSSIIIAVTVSTLIGVVFGLYPAYTASKLSPIEALRYE